MQENYQDRYARIGDMKIVLPHKQEDKEQSKR